MSPGPQEAAVDDRTARRERNRDAVLDAAHELFVEGQLLPGVEDVAARAGVSLRSVYRYFPDGRQLRLAALARRIAVAEPQFILADVGEGPLEDRVDRFVAQRLTVYDVSAPTIRAAFAMASTVPEIGVQVQRRKHQLTEQARAHFAPELGQMPPDRAESVLVCVELLTQFESMEVLRLERGLSRERAHAILAAGVRTQLLGAPTA